MRKIALMVCVLMLLSIAACTNNNGNTDTGKGTDITDKAAEGDNAVDNNGIAEEGAVTGNDEGNSKNGENKTLTGMAKGYGGDVSVTVEVNGNDIVSVKAVGEKETEGVGSKAIDELPGKIEKANSTDVEAVSGATVTSNAIKEAVNKALEGVK